MSLGAENVVTKTINIRRKLEEISLALLMFLLHNFVLKFEKYTGSKRRKYLIFN